MLALEKQIALQAIERAQEPLAEIDPSIDADPVSWITEHFYVPELSGPIGLHPSQAVPLAEALRRDEGGLFQYSTVVWSSIKKSAKSTIAAAVGLWFAFRRSYASVKVIANDLKQADSRVFYYMRRAIELHPEWRDGVKVTNYRIELPNKSVIEAIPIDPKGEAGANDDCVIYSEIWGWKHKTAQRMWTETTLSPLKYGESLRWCETYAGYKGDSPVLEQLYATGVENGTVINADYEMYTNQQARQFTLWNTKPHLPWQTPAYYAQERGILDAAEYDRVHRNQWQIFVGRVYPDFDLTLNVTNEAEYSPAKGPVYWGCDDGYAHGQGPGTASYHPRVILLAQRNALGGLDIFAEYGATLVATHEESIREVLSWGYPKPEAAYIDSSAPMFGAVLFTKFDIYAVGATHHLVDGIKKMRLFICDSNKVRRLRVHSRCVSTRRELQSYRYAESGTAKSGEVPTLKVDDHFADAARYLVWVA